MIEDDERQELYRDYTATMQRHLVNLLGRFLSGDEWQEVPSYLEMSHESAAQKAPTQETNEDAKAHVYAAFGVNPPERG